MDHRRQGSARCVLVLALVALACGCAKRQPQEMVKAAGSQSSASASEIRGVDSFAQIADRAERSRALFAEASRVFLHPRCVNCHPDGDTPHQGMDLSVHDPPVVRGPDDTGVVGVQCTSCHQDHNLELALVPGAPGWHLAPRSMAWVGKTPGEICRQMKDPSHNGGRTLAQIIEHNAHDSLVAMYPSQADILDRHRLPVLEQAHDEADDGRPDGGHQRDRWLTPAASGFSE